MRFSSAWVVVLLALASLAGAQRFLESDDARLASFGGRGDAGPGSGNSWSYTVDVTGYTCAYGDGACLSYGGTTPGPTYAFEVGDSVTILLRNRIAETLEPLAIDADLKARLSASSVSLHVHGMNIDASMDGIMAHPGTNFIDSSAPPGGNFTYSFQPLHAGAWHYHDHVIGPDGAEGQIRGLFGTILVLPVGGSSGTVLDYHIMDAGVNAGRGLSYTGAVGEHIRVLVAGLGNYVWTVKLLAPSGATLSTLSIGPGVSDQFDIPSATAGTYKIKATSVYTAATYTSNLVIQ